VTTLEQFENVLTALAIWREARGESLAARDGVYHVIRNRTLDAANRWPKTFSGVILQTLQFSSFNAHDPNAAKIPTATDGAFIQCCAIVDSPGADPTSGANHYLSIPAGDPLPSWADSNKITCTIGPFTFYRF